MCLWLCAGFIDQHGTHLCETKSVYSTWPELMSMRGVLCTILNILWSIMYCSVKSFEALTMYKGDITHHIFDSFYLFSFIYHTWVCFLITWQYWAFWRRMCSPRFATFKPLFNFSWPGEWCKRWVKILVLNVWKVSDLQVIKGSFHLDR